MKRLLIVLAFGAILNAQTTCVNCTGSSGGGALVLLEEHTASAASSLSFTSWYSASYDDYLIKVVTIVPSTSGASIQLQFSTNGGSSYDSGSNYAWGVLAFNTSSSGSAGSTSDTSITLLRLLNGATNWSASGSYNLYSPGASVYKSLTGLITTRDTTNSTTEGTLMSATYLSTSAVNAFTVFASTGTFTGTVRVYGLTH